MKRKPHAQSQRGAVAVQYALGLTLFTALIIAVIEMSRLMFIYVTAVEATRLGARVAVVCPPRSDAQVKAIMAGMLPILAPANITLRYPAAGCTSKTCEPVTVAITGVTVTAAIPLVPLTFNVPPFATALPAESLDGTNNISCQ